MSSPEDDSSLERDFYTVSECANLFSVTRKSILNWIYNGKLKAFTTGGGRYRIYKNEVEHFKRSTGFNHSILKIFIIDDDQLVLRALSRNISKLYPHIEVHTCESGIKSVYKAGLINPDLLILDIKMPEMDGFEVIEELHNANAELNILIISGYLNDDNISRLKAMGIRHYLSKPIDIWKMKDKIDAILGYAVTG